MASVLWERAARAASRRSTGDVLVDALIDEYPLARDGKLERQGIAVRVRHELIGPEPAAVGDEIDLRVTKAEIARLGKGEVTARQRRITGRAPVGIRKRTRIRPHSEPRVIEERHPPVRMREVGAHLRHRGERRFEARRDIGLKASPQRMLDGEQVAEDLIVIGRRALEVDPVGEHLLIECARQQT